MCRDKHRRALPSRCEEDQETKKEKAMTLTKPRHVTIFGGSGFVGRHIVRALAKTGVQIRVAIRKPNEALFLKTAGRVGQIELMQVNICDPSSVKRALEGTEAVINAVGILFETGSQKFDSVQAIGAANVAKLAKKAGIKTFIHISAIGADLNSASLYAQSKARGEQAVMKSIPTAIVLRPSLVIGPEDDFFNRFAQMASLAPFLPLIGGGKTLYQPVQVYDLAACVVAAIGAGEDKAGCYHIGGPRIYSFKALMELLLAQIGRKTLLLPMPYWAAGLIARIAQFAPKPLLTPDQLIMLRQDNIVTGENGLQVFGVDGQSIEAILPDYLARYRKS